ncbi:MAG: bestrophin family protein, partial [Croceimicrobium sp.]
MVGIYARRYQRKFGLGLINDEVTKIELQQFLAEDEYEQMLAASNTATQIVYQQGKDLKMAFKTGAIDDFRHMELQKLLNSLYDHQGKCERIKKFPLPRQYANMSFIFVGIFIFLMPFGLLPEFAKFGDFGTWTAIPFMVLVAWLFVVMEIVGDYSENPFQGMANDIPMLSLCRTIEIDLLEMLGETDLPAPIEAKKGILM